MSMRCFNKMNVAWSILLALIFLSLFTSSWNFLAPSTHINGENQTFNDRPIIGILSQEISYLLDKKYPGQYDSYIAASYVKFIEGAGGRVVPIWIGQSEKYYANMLEKVNGILWPGGTTWFNQSNGYADAAYIIYKLAKSINEKGIYFPILGICLGFEVMTYVAANRSEHRIDCSASSLAVPLVFNSGFRNSKMFRDMPSEMSDVIQKENVTVNFHRFCVTEKILDQLDLSKEFLVTSTNRDRQGLKFISTFEHKNFPFYGLQFHPEKNLYEWVVLHNIPHGPNASSVSQYFANFFLNEARKNFNHFPSDEEEELQLIYNYHSTYTGLLGSAFEQCYLFNAKVRINGSFDSH